MDFKTNVGLTWLLLMGLLGFIGGALGMILAFIQCPELTFLLVPYATPSFAIFIVGIILLSIASITGKKLKNKDKEDTETGARDLLDSIDEV